MSITVSELLKTILLAMMIGLLFSVTSMLVQVQDMNTFKQNVNYTIEREGGLTPTAVAQIKKESKDNYHDSFTISSAQMNQGLPYGTVVSYKITQTISVVYGDRITFDIEREGSSVSQIRKFN